MKIIRISKKYYQKLATLDLPKEVNNTEGNMYLLNYRGNEKVFKQLFHQQGLVFANKLYTIEMLDNMKEYLPESFFIPDSLVAVNDDIEGFTVPKFNGVNLSLILKSKLSHQEKIYYLKKVGEILEQMHNIRAYTPLKDFYLNDLHESNFMVNTNKKQLGVIDLDSCKIGNNLVSASKYLSPLALLNYVSNKYQIMEDEKNMGYVNPDENSDLYCYEIMILNYLYGENINNLPLEDFYEYLNYLEKIGINQNLIDLWAKLLVNTNNENPIDYLNSIKEEQVYRARKKVYQTFKVNVS